MYRQPTIRRRVITAILIVCFVLVAVDSDRVPFFTIGPLYWIITAFLGLAYFTGSRRFYAAATACLVSVSVLRSLLFFLDDGRVAPIGLNGAIATLAVAVFIGPARSV